MRRVGLLTTMCGLLCSFAAPVWAQDDGEPASPREAPAQTEEEKAPASSSEDAQAYATPQGTFPIRRGFFVAGDFGVFLAIGGRNTNSELPSIPTRSTSNLEPTVGLTVGYDLVSSPGLNLALGLRGAILLNGGSGRVTAEDAMAVNGEDPKTRSNDFSIYQTGLAVQADFYVSDRLSVSTKLDGGLAILNPDPSTAAATTPPNREVIAGSGGAGIGGIGSVGVGVNYATLLTGFQIGLDVRFIGVFFDGFIPALSATVPIKYNF